MSRPPLPPDEAERLAALRRYEILDTLPEQSFDDLTLLAARIFNAPIALIGFTDVGRQWFKSKVGLTTSEVPRFVSFCSHAIVEPDVCVIHDAHADQRFAGNPLVTSEPHIRFYAGAQLVTPEGHAIGAICVIDHVPRDLSAEQEETLRVLARQVMAQLELRRNKADLERALATRERDEEEILFQASLLNAVEEAVIATDLSGKILYWNRFAERMYGWAAAEASGRNVVEIIASDISQGEAAEIMSRLTRGESWSGEFIVQRRGGSSFPAQVTDSPIYSRDGVLIGIVGISTDITERKRAEEALGKAHAELERRVAQRTAELTTANALLKEEVDERERAEQALLESNSLLRGVIEGTNDYIFAKDLDGRYLMVNSAAANFVGRPAEEIVGKTDVELFPPEVAQHLVERDRQVIASGEMLTLEERLLYRGTRQTALVTKNVYRNDEGEIVGLIGISRDLTERKRMEDSLRESEAKFRRIFDSDMVGIIFWDTSGRINDANDAFLQLTGYTKEDLLAGRLRWTDMTPPELLHLDEEGLKKLKRGETFPPFEKEYFRKDGTRVPILIGGAFMDDVCERGVSFVLDITERKRMEDKIRESEQQLAIAQQIAHVGSWEWDIAADKVTWSDELYRIFGLRPQEFGATYERFIGVVHPDDRELVVSAGGKALLRHEFADHEYRIVRPNGEVRILLGRGGVVTDEAGRAARVYGTTEDITERKQVEQELRKSEEHFRLLVEGIKEYAIFMLDTDGYITSWNEGAARLKGYAAEEIIGQHCSVCYTPEDVALGKPASDLKQAAATGRHEGERWAVREDGTRFWADVLITAARDEQGRLRGFVDFTRDVTERRRAEESLRLFESAIEQANEAITITASELDPPGPRIIFVNPAFTRMTGYSAAEVLGRTPRILQGPKTERAVLDELREKLARGEAFEGVAINYRKDGTEFYMEWRVDHIRNERGEVTHFVAVQRDVTERVRAKEARMQMQRQLIAAQEEERRRLARELHDQIGQYVPALKLGLKALKVTAPAQPHHAAQVEQLQEIATNIAHDVQNLARELRPAALDEFGLANALTSYAEEWSQRHGIAVDFHCTGFDGDEHLPSHVETALYRIAQEAFTNILKHARARDVSLILERKRRGVKMIVEDDGQGFDVEALMKAPPAERRLGLIGMRERVALINGSLQIESAPGAGTTIVVNLPVPAKEEGDAP